MKRLVKIVFVQWYLFDTLEIPLIGHTAVIGGNGAGKSSILDGVQTVLTGVDRGKISLNKGSNEKSSRTIREYCLGVVSDPNATVKIPPREEANTYIALCFYDDKTGEHISIGVSLWASLADPKDDICGYFLTRGSALGVADFIDKTDAGTISLPWNQVRDRLVRRFKLGNTLQLPHKGPGHFRRTIYTQLSEDPGYPNDSETVVKSILSALTFKPINDPTEFVRKNMLEQDNIAIGELSESLRSWRALRDKTVETDQCIKELERLDKICSDVEAGREDILRHEWVSVAARNEKCFQDLDPLQVDFDELNEVIDQKTKQVTGLEQEREEVQDKLTTAKEELAKSDIEGKIRALAGQQELARKEQGATKTTLGLHRRQILKLSSLEPSRKFVSKELLAEVAGLLKCAEMEDDLLSKQWPASIEEAAQVDQGVQVVLAESPRVTESIAAHTSGLWQKIVPLQEEIKDLKTNIAQLEKGEPPLSSKTRGLMQLLEKEGIKATPLCDLIDVTDEAWRATIESILGRAREALIVSSKQAEPAIRLYRHEGRDFRGALVVNTTKTEEWLKRSIEGSLAELVQTDDPHAQAFIALRLGNVICVDNEKDLLKHSRAATPDLMYANAGTITAQQEVLPILGRKNREELRQRLTRRLEAQETLLGQYTDSRKNMESLRTALLGFCEYFSAAETLHRPLLVVCLDLDVKVKQLGEQIEQLRQQEDVYLKQQIMAFEETLLTIVQRLKETRESLNADTEKRGGVRSQIDILEGQAKVLGERLEEMRAQPGFDSARAADTLERLRDKFDAGAVDYNEMVLFIDGHINRRQAAIRQKENQVTAGLASFVGTYSGKAHLLAVGDSVPETFEEEVNFIRDERERLVETTLAEYKERAENALAQVEVTFRTKFISRLVERLGRVRETIATLNDILKHRPFHGETYRFRCAPNPELEAVYDFAKAIEEDRDGTGASIGGLFDPAVDRESPHQKAIEQINLAFQDDAEAKRLQDYRNYYVFDVEMYDKDGNKAANLKHRVAKGSGGENMAPFYVAIGSSLSSAYRIQKRPMGDGVCGMNLAPFDEAFSKLDAANCYNCLEFLKDVSLQVLLAAPDEKYTALAAQVDTVVWIYRDGGDVEIEVEYLTRRTHELLQSDNPFIEREEVDDTTQLQPAGKVAEFVAEESEQRAEDYPADKSVSG